MTILSSKKPPNNNKDSSTNQQQPPSQPQQTSALTRTRLSRDDEHSNGATSSANLLEDTNDINTASSASSSTTTTTTAGAAAASNLHPVLTTTTSPIFSNNSKRKFHSQHHRHLPQTISKQARRRDVSLDENLSTNTTSDPSTKDHSDENTDVSSSLITTTAANNSLLDEMDQCNSEDEYEQTAMKYDRNNLNEHEMHFVNTLKEKKGFVIKPVQEDGACLFRAVSDQVFGDEEMHSTVRRNCMDYIVKNADFFREYITEDFDHYVTRKRQQNCHGNHIEMIALSELYNRPIEVYEYSIEPINVVHGMYKTDNEPIRLSYHCGVHYNSIIDPWRPTAGHGLGFPDLEPGRAQESLIVTAIRQSEESHIERAMLDDKLAATDWEATQDELIQQIAKESYLQWLRDTNQQHKDNQSMLPSSSSSATTSEKSSNAYEASTSKDLLPLRLDERKDCEFALPFHYEGGTSTDPDLDDDDDEESLMRQVLAMSQIEYVETLKKQQQHESTSNDPNEPSTSSDKNFL